MILNVKIIYLLFFCMLTSSMFSQSKQNKNTQFDNNYKMVYSNAIKIQDYQTAINSCHYIISLEGENSIYKDSLTFLYYLNGGFQQAILTGLSQLKEESNNINLLYIVADSYHKIGDFKTAIIYQEKLCNLSPVVKYEFSLLEMQMEMKRFSEAINTGSKLLNGAIDEKLNYYYQDSLGSPQQTPLKAAIYNYLGFAHYNNGDKTNAKKMFESALLIDNKFLIAKMNLIAIDIDENNSGK